MNIDNKTEIFVVLNDGFTAPKEFYDYIKTLIEEVLPVLIPEEAYTSKELCGPDFWDSLKKGEPLLVGRCVIDMVRKGTLPLRPVGCEHQYPKRYALK